MSLVEPERYGTGCAVADFDNDGFPDLGYPSYPSFMSTYFLTNMCLFVVLSHRNESVLNEAALKAVEAAEAAAEEAAEKKKAEAAAAEGETKPEEGGESKKTTKAAAAGSDDESGADNDDDDDSDESGDDDGEGSGGDSDKSDDEGLTLEDLEEEASKTKYWPFSFYRIAHRSPKHKALRLLPWTLMGLSLCFSTCVCMCVV